MDLRYLKAFLFTARHKSFSKAAIDLSIAQSAVSRQVRLFEESIGQELLIRSSTQIILTETAEKLLEHGQRFLSMSQEIIKTKESTSTIRIGILEGLLENWFTTIIEKHIKTSRNSLEITVGPPAYLRGLLKTSKLDIVISPEEIQSDLITSKHLFVEGLSLISSHKINTKDLQSYRWIVYGSEDYLFTLQKKKSSSIFKVNSLNAMISLVKKDLGIAIVPNHSFKKEDGLVGHFLPNLKGNSIYLTTLAYREYPSAIREIVDIIHLNPVNVL